MDGSLEFRDRVYKSGSIGLCICMRIIERRHKGLWVELLLVLN